MFCFSFAFTVYSVLDKNRNNANFWYSFVYGTMQNAHSHAPSGEVCGSLNIIILPDAPFNDKNLLVFVGNKI